MQRTHLIGVSIPRAGHHYLVSLLEKALGDDFAHCEFYTPDNCCRNAPCSRPRGRVFYQKNHDFDLGLPTDLPGVLYVVQTRDPVHAILSEREYLGKMESETRAADRDDYLVWLGQKALYLERFHRKWIAADIHHRLVIDYDELADQGAVVLDRLLKACGVPTEAERLRAAVAGVSGVSVSFPAKSRTGAFTRRTIQASRFFDAELLGVFESLLADRSPGIQRNRHLPPADYRNHPLGLVFFSEEARVRGDNAAALDFIQRACDAAPTNKYLAFLRVDLLAAVGKIKNAIEAADALHRADPDSPAILRRLSDLRAASAGSELRCARELAERLVHITPDDSGARIHLANLLLRMNEAGAAQDQAVHATSRAPLDPHVWRTASEIFAACRNWAPAEDAVRNALRIDPTQAEFYHHRANMLALLGRIDEASQSHREAVARAPAITGWRWKWSEDLIAAGRRDEARKVLAEGLRAAPDDPLLKGQMKRLDLPA